MCSLTRNLLQVMKHIITISIILASISLFGQTKIVDLKDCLTENSTSPKEYILNIFKTNDIVIIGERNHNDTTQYDLLLEIISDKRFIEDVANVYTEVGCVNRTEWANQVLKTNFENDREFEMELIKLYRELDFNPLWEKYNMYKLLKGIYKINRNLQRNNKLTIGFTDLAFEWEGMTRKKYQEFQYMMNANSYTRDSIMASNFIHLYEKQVSETGRNKALLIQSFPHAVKMDLRPYGSKIRRTGSYIAEKYNNNVKVVAFNSVYFGAYNSSNNSLINNGKWDAAFEMTSCRKTAFNIESTSFGKTLYEDNFAKKIDKALNVKFNYDELIDGIIFYKPFYEFKCTAGIPNIVDKQFSNELMHRTIICQDKFTNRLGLKLLRPFYKKPNTNYYNNVRTFECYDNEALKRQMNDWIN